MTTPAYIAFRRFLSVRPAICCLAFSAAMVGSPTALSAQTPTIEGVWAVVITPRDCATNAPLPVPAFRTLLTFFRDGTTTESVGTLSFAPGQRSSGHGTWTHTGGSTFRERTVAMILFDGGIYQPGWQVITRTITLTDANHYTSTGPSQFFDLSRQLYRTACASSVGERFQ